MPQKILLIRHGEKPDDERNHDLDTKGRIRAMALVPFLLESPALLGGQAATALFATKTSADGGGVRAQQTLRPLATTLHLEVRTPFKKDEVKGLAEHLETERELANGVVVVCWDHHYLPELAAALGASPEPDKWGAKIYDRVWVVKRDQGRVQFDDRPQRLLFGDDDH